MAVLDGLIRTTPDWPSWSSTERHDVHGHRPHSYSLVHGGIPRAFAIVSMLAGMIIGEAAHANTFDRAPFGTTQDGQAVDEFTMTNNHGLRIRFISYGGIITAIYVPDRSGQFDDIVLGLKTLREYETIGAAYHFGGIIGRYANQIGEAQFTLHGRTYHLIANHGAHTLHGGPDGLDRRVWTVSPTPVPNGVAATLVYISKDGEENFPGTLTVHVTYTLTNNNELRIDYQASTDKDTVINLTSHSHFNLSGNGSGSVENQMLLVNADRYAPMRGPDKIPTGELAPVAGTPFDFRQMTSIGARLHSRFQQMVYAHGYGHDFLLNRRPGNRITFAARAFDPRSGRVIDCFTTEPALEVYTSNFFDGSVVGSSGTKYRQNEAFTLATQHFPDSPNKPSFPTTELKPGQDFRSTTIFRFATDAPLPQLPR
jgi:aldose 1-epimerase